MWQEEISGSDIFGIGSFAVGGERDLHRHNFGGRIRFDMAVGISGMKSDFGDIPGSTFFGPVGRKQVRLGSNIRPCEFFTTAERIRASPVVVSEIVTDNQLAVSAGACRSGRSAEYFSFAEIAAIVPVETICAADGIGGECGVRIVPVVAGVPGFLQVRILARGAGAIHDFSIGDILFEVLAHGPVQLRAAASVAGQPGGIRPVPVIVEPDRSDGLGVPVVIVGGEEIHAGGDLPLVAHAYDGICLPLRPAQCRYADSHK